MMNLKFMNEFFFETLEKELILLCQKSPKTVGNQSVLDFKKSTDFISSKR